MNTKDFDWESDKTNELVERLNDFMGCNYSRCTEHGSLLQKKTIHELRIADRDNYRQQLLKAVEEMKKVVPHHEWEQEFEGDIDQGIGYNKAIEDILELLKAKDYMEGEK